MLRWIFRLILIAFALPAIYLAWTAADIWQTSHRDERTKADSIVVMGAAQYDGTPSTIFKARLDHAKLLYQAKVAPLIVILGGKQPGDRFTEAQAGAAYLEKSLPADKVTGVKAGRNTLESLRDFNVFARGRKIKSAVIVSDPLHVRRAEEMARDLGFVTSGSPATITESQKHRRLDLVKETLLLTYYRVFKRG